MSIQLSVVSSVIFFLTICLIKSSIARQYPNSPCPDVFQYRLSGNKNIGLITVKDVQSGDTTVEIELSYPGNVQSDNPGSLSLNFNKDKILEYLNSGNPFTYRVDFPNNNIIPRVVYIKVNNMQICLGSPYEPPHSCMTLSYTLKTFSSQQPNINRASNFGLSVPRFDVHGFLRFSPTYMERMSQNQNSNYQNSDFYASSFKPPSFNNYNNNNGITFSSFLRPPSSSKSFYNNQNNFASSYGQPILNNPMNGLTSMLPQENIYKNPFINKKYPLPITPTLPQFNQNTNFPSIGQPLSPSFINPFLPKTNNLPETTNQPTFPVPSADTPSPPVGIVVRNPEIKPTDISPSSTDLETFESLNKICGRENLNSDMNRLNVKGQLISESRFPWIVAVFKRIDDDLTFQCGGNLISRKTIISAAHCFYLGLEMMKPEMVMVSMGLHNLTKWPHANNIYADQIIPHPDYNVALTKLDADVALVLLKDSIVYTNAIKPICMWQGAVDLSEIEGLVAIMVGWGSDGRRNTTIVPTLVKATVVSESTCLRSNEDFLPFTSSRTLCAGNVDGSGPCLGDSGNGLIIRNRNKWTLRGTVSATLGSPTQQCQLQDFAIYADIAMFMGWIKSNMAF